MATKFVEDRIREARLIVASPEQVLIELKQYDENLKGRFWEEDKELEIGLLSRHDPLIDLGLARYARTKEVVSTLYKKAALSPKGAVDARYLRGLKIAVLSNEGARTVLSAFPMNVIGDEEFARVLREDDEELLTALLTNPALDTKFLESLYKNEGVVSTLPDERRRRFILISSDNPRLLIDRGNEHGPDLGFMGIHKAIVTLLATAPVTEDWLVTLRMLIEKLNPSKVHWPDGPITPILERWSKIPESGDKDNREGYYTTLSFRDETLCLIAAMYGRHSTRDKGSKISFAVMGGPEAPEVFVRCAYYGKGDLTENEMKAGFARDEYAYVLAVLCNDHVFFKATLRKLLEGEQLRGDLRHVYRRRCEQIHEEWSSFDPRPVSEWLIEELPTPSDELTLLRQLEEKVTEISKALGRVQAWVLWGFIIIGAIIIYAHH